MKNKDTLSVVLPVHNDGATLSRRITDLLELLPELTRQFEILILDNASTDLTDEVAYELAREYPQLRLMRQTKKETERAILELGLRNTTGDLVMVFDEKFPILPSRLKQLWELGSGRSTSDESEQGGPAAGASLVGRLESWASQLPSESDRLSVQLLRRTSRAQRSPPESNLAPPLWSASDASSVPS